MKHPNVIELTDVEAGQICGGGQSTSSAINTAGSAVVCLGSVGAIVGTEGAASPWLIGIAIGSCAQAGSSIGGQLSTESSQPLPTGGLKK